MAVGYSSFVKISGDFGGGSGNISATVPSGLTTDDTWIIWGSDDNNGSDGNINVPTGFTAIDAGHRTGGGFPFARGFWKTAGASESAVNVPYQSGTYGLTTFSVRLTGANTTNPIGNITTTTGSASATTIAVTAVTIQNASSLALSHVAGYRAASVVTPTAPATMTRISYENLNDYQHAGIGYELVNAGSYSPGNWTYSAANSNRLCTTVEILPAATGGTTYNDSITESMSLAETVASVLTTTGTASESLSLAETTNSALTTSGSVTESLALADSETGTLPGSGVTLTLTRPDSGATGTGSLTNGDLTWTSGTGYNRAWSTTKYTLDGTSKVLVAFHFDTNTTSGDVQVGFGTGASASGEGTNFLGNNAGEIGMYRGDGYLYQGSSNNGRSTEGGFAQGDWILYALDLTDTTNGPRVFAKKYSGGVESGWNEGMVVSFGTQDPTNYTGSAMGFSASMTDYYFEFQSAGSGDVFTVDFTGASYPGTTTLSGYSWWDAGGGGTTYTGSASEAISLADTVSSTLTTAGAISESLTLADTETSALTTAGSVSEALALAETASGLMSASMSVSEALSLVDTMSTQMVTSGTATEAITLSETPSGLGIFASSRSEALALSDSSVGNVTQDATVSEALGLTETATGGLLVSASISEALSLSETTAGALVVTFSLGEALSLADTSSGSLIMSATQAEALSLVDAEGTGGGIATGDTQEALSLTDTVSATLVTSGSVLESLSLADGQSGDVAGGGGGPGTFSVGGNTVQGRFLPVTVVTVEGTIPRRTDD